MERNDSAATADDRRTCPAAATTAAGGSAGEKSAKTHNTRRHPLELLRPRPPKSPVSRPPTVCGAGQRQRRRPFAKQGSGPSGDRPRAPRMQ